MRRCKVIFTKRQLAALLDLDEGVCVTGFKTSQDPDYLSVFLDVEHMKPQEWDSDDTERIVIWLEEVQRRGM